MSVVGVGNSYYSAFNPLNLGDCALWLDAADTSTLTLSGSNVTQWNDKSGNSRHLSQATAGNRPTYSTVNQRSFVNFTAANSNFMSNTSMTIDYRTSQIFLVFQRKTVQSGLNPGLFAPLTAGQSGDWTRTDGFEISTSVEVGSAGSGASDGQLSNLNLTTYAFSINNNSLTTFRDFGSNSVITRSIGLTAVPNALYLGIRRDGPSLNYPSDVYFGEALVYNRLLSTSEYQQVEGYLAKKWGLSGGGIQTITPFTPTSITGCQLWLDGGDSNNMTISVSGGVASLNQYITTTAQNVPYTGTMTGVSSMTGGTCIMNGSSIGTGGSTPTAGFLAPSASSGQWYAYCIDGAFIKVVKTQFVLTGSNLTVQGLSAGFTGTSNNYISTSNSGSTNDTYYSGYSPVSIATSSNTANYGVQSFSMNFTPSSLTSNISQWNDKSGNGRNATQSTLVNAPTFVNDSGYPAVSFSQASQKYLVGSSLLNSTSNSIFIVYRTLSPASTQYVFFDYKKTTGGTGQNFVQLIIIGSNTSANIIYSESPVTSKNSPSVPITTSRLMFEMIDSPTNTTQNFYNTGSLLATSYTNGGISDISTDTYGYTLGALRTTSPSLTNTFDGYIYEVIVFTNELTTVQRQQIEGYLANKWGLVSSLPASHPYARAPRLPTTHPYSSIVPMTRGFAPVDVAGLQLWLDAADPNSVTLSGSNVTQWRDKSGNGTNASQATTSNQPIYQSNSMNGLPSIQFNAISRNNLVCFDTPAFDFGTSARSAFFVIRNNFVSGTVAASPHWFWPKTGNGTNALSLVGWISATVQGQAGGASATFNRNQILLLGYRFGITSAYEELFSNATTVATATKTTGGSSYANATSGYRIGGLDNLDVGSSTYWFDGNIGEILLFNRALTSSERQQIEGYLARKWGLASVQASPPLPTTISGINAWYDGADPLGTGVPPSVNTSLGTWYDKSGNGRNASGGVSPTFVSGGVSFNGSSSYLNMSIPYSSNYSIFLVATNTSVSQVYFFGRDSIGGGREPTFIQGYIGAGIGLEWYESSDRGTIATTPSSPFIASIDHTQGSSIQGYYFGTQSFNISQTRAYFSNAWDTLGRPGASIATGWYGGIMKELIFFSNTLTTTQRQNVEGYLAVKWGLQSSLPSTHPYALRGLPSTHPFISRLPVTTVFNPRQISGCALWLDAADPSTLTLSGSNISQWSDKSGNGYNFTPVSGFSSPTIASNSINSNTSVSFTGPSTQNSSASQYLTNSTFPLNSSSSGYSIFVVARQNTSRPSYTGYNYIISAYAGGAGSGLFYGTEPNGFLLTANGTAGPSYGFNDLTANSPNTTMTTAMLTGIIVSGSTLTPYMNGTAMSTKTGTVIALTGISIGDAYAPGQTFSGQNWNGNIGEILLFNRALTTSQRQQVEGYLSWKWGLNGGYSSSIAPFTPTSVTGCQLWLDAADSSTLTLSGSSVTQWNDKSGNQRNFNQPTSGSRPTYVSNGLNNYPIVRFASAFLSNVGFPLYASASSGMSFFAVFNTTNRNQQTAILAQMLNGTNFTETEIGFSYASGTGYSLTNYGSIGLHRGNGAVTQTASNAINSNVTYVYSAIASNTGSTPSSIGLFLNGTQNTSIDFNTGMSNGFYSPGSYPIFLNSVYLGARNDRGPINNYLAGDIAELILYNTVISSTQRQQIEGYLALKWGLTSSLPSTHPYTNRSLPSTHPYKLIQPGFINTIVTLTFTYAWYGSTNGGSGKSVTSTVQSVYDSGAATITLGNGTFGDPQPGVPKYTWITYTKSGTSYSIGPYGEGTVLTFSSL